MKSLLDSTEDPELAIQALRRQKIETKLFHLRNKILPKQMKKVKTFLIQRVVKKIKLAKELSEIERKTLDDELLKAKALDHVKLSGWAFSSQVIAKDEYLMKKFQELEMKLEESPESCEEFSKVQSIKSFQDAIRATRSDLVLFIRKLVHEEEAPAVKTSSTTASTAKHHEQKQRPLSADKSYFISNLNEDSEEDSQDDSENVAFTDDEEEEKYYREELAVPEKKKNRPGQMARRRLAELKFGKEAKHIQSGGLTVQEKEALRKQKSEQRKDRLARIKKEASAKGTNTAKVSLKPFVKEEGSKVNATHSVTIVKPEIKLDPTMHPSWAAKLQQQHKTASASFQGQKIKFED